MIRPGATLLLAALAASACDQVVRVGGSGFELLVNAPSGPLRDLDILFVIDDSGSMREEQDQLAASLGRFVEVLDERAGGRPGLHLGVTSSDLGTAPMVNPRCEAEGDRGRLLTEPAGRDCPAVNGRFLIDVPGEGGRITNYPAGQLAATLSCNARLGTGGCGFEQPLEAARRALDGFNPENAGFLRDAAALAVFFVTDEDDCSVRDRSLFDPSQNDRAAPLGELSSFRCFEFGVSCAGGDASDPRSLGPRSDCRPRDDSPYMTPVADFAEFLRRLKPDPAMVLVGGIFGDAAPVAVDELDGVLALRDVCPAAGVSATPAVRLHALTAAFPGPRIVASLCEPDPSARLAALASASAAALRAPLCLRRAPIDADPDRAGVQPVCRAFLVADQDRRELASCQDGTAACFAIEPDPDACAFTDSKLALRLRGEPPAPGHRLHLECLAEPVPPGPVD